MKLNLLICHWVFEVGERSLNRGSSSRVNPFELSRSVVLARATKMQNSAMRKRPHPSSAARSPDKFSNDNSHSESPSNSENVPPPASLFFPAGERRPDLERQSSESNSKRLCVDAPNFSQKGLNEGLAAREPAARDALMGMATGALVYYGTYFEQNKILRELAFERETRIKFGRRHQNEIYYGSNMSDSQDQVYSASNSSGGNPDYDEDDL